MKINDITVHGIYVVCDPALSFNDFKDALFIVSEDGIFDMESERWVDAEEFDCNVVLLALGKQILKETERHHNEYVEEEIIK